MAAKKVAVMGNVSAAEWAGRWAGETAAHWEVGWAATKADSMEVELADSKVVETVDRKDVVWVVAMAADSAGLKDES